MAPAVVNLGGRGKNCGWEDTMGVWEDALREAAAQRYEEVQALGRERVQAAEQKRALSAFIEAMQRLQIRPQRQPFLVLKGTPERDRYRASLRHKIVGW